MVPSPRPLEPSPKGRQFSALASVLARAVTAEEIGPSHALRILRHELRRMNVNRAMKAPMRSAGAQQVIDRYGELGEPIPKNGSNDALPCDHVHAVTAEDLRALVTLEDWVASLADEDSPPA